MVDYALLKKEIKENKMEWGVIFFIIIYLCMRDEQKLNSCMSEESQNDRKLRKEYDDRAAFLYKKHQEKLRERFEKERYENHKRTIEAFEKVSITGKL